LFPFFLSPVSSIISVIFCFFKAFKVRVNLLCFNSVADQGELAMQRGLGGFPHERLHQEAKK
jgi:hypothetical protein